MLRNLILLVLMISCQRESFSPPSQPSTANDCELPLGDYIVQKASHHADKGTYQLILLGAPSCVKQPMTFAALRLSRLEEEEKKEAAKLTVEASGDPILAMAANFQISLVQEVVRPSGQVEQQSSFWSPFLAGAAGAVGGAMLANALSRPKYYTPPPPSSQPGQVVSGYGGSGETRQQAVRSYQRKYPNARPLAAGSSRTTEKKNFFKPKPTAKPKTQSRFFKKRGSSRGFKRRR